MMRLTGSAAERDFLARVVEESGQDLSACIQCGKCSGGCPITSDEVGGPRRLIAEILYGAKREALRDPTWWYCVACGTCMTRCPVEIDVSRVATVLCEMAEHAGLEPSEPSIHLFEKLFVDSVEAHGRANELRVTAGLNMRTRQPFKDMGAAMTMFRKGTIGPGDFLKAHRATPAITRIFSKVREKDRENGR